MFAKAAQRLGIRAYQHTSFETTKSILENLKQENQH
jgi:putative hydrolase of the HAD superfamily